jgi:hypothetical protein
MPHTENDQIVESTTEARAAVTGHNVRPQCPLCIADQYVGGDRGIRRDEMVTLTR